MLRISSIYRVLDEIVQEFPEMQEIGPIVFDPIDHGYPRKVLTISGRTDPAPLLRIPQEIIILAGGGLGIQQEGSLFEVGLEDRGEMSEKLL